MKTIYGSLSLNQHFASILIFQAKVVSQMRGKQYHIIVGPLYKMHASPMLMKIDYSFKFTYQTQSKQGPVQPPVLHGEFDLIVRQGHYLLWKSIFMVQK